jgi:dTDP-4-dehydrorhamnose reductase
MTMKALVIGASGQVGFQLMARLKRNGDEAVGTYSEHPVSGFLHLDLRSSPECEQRIREVRPDAVLCAAGMTNVELCETEPALARAINVQGPLACARAADEVGARFVYFSTEYVFDGRNGPYSEDDPIHPLSVYGRSKAEAEDALRRDHPSALIIRTTVVYGLDPQAKNFVCQLLARAKRGEPMRVPDDQVSSPTYNEDLAAATLRLAEMKASGIFHVTGPDVMDRFAFARVACEVFGLNPGFLSPVKTPDLKQKAARPLKAGLRIEKLISHTGYRPLGARQGLETMKRRLADEPKH